jgi:hypothetical protein
MRLFIAVILLILIVVVVPMTLGEMAVPAAASEGAEKDVALYDPNPAHIWNRLYDAVLVREDAMGGKYGVDSLDPLLWLETEHLLAQPSHRLALRVLDEFLQAHAENQIHDPVKRAILQRDLWAVFDWSAQPHSYRRPAYDGQKRELQIRLAEVLRRLALTAEEIKSLPANYGQALASGAFAKEYDPGRRDRAFLPPDLFEPNGPWVLIEGGSYFGPQPVAIGHVMASSGRSRFLVFVRLPGGRKFTLDYLGTLWNFAQPWAPSDPPYQVDLNPALPSFPAGTEVALVRQMTLFDDHGNLVEAPITESVQIRVYRAITMAGPTPDITSMPALAERSGQDFYEIRLSRPQLFANKSGGLRATAPDEMEFSTFQQQGFDFFEWWLMNRSRPASLVSALQECPVCHSAGGINSLNSRRNLLKPNELQHDSPGGYGPQFNWWAGDETKDWKHDRYDWGLLNGYWRAGNGLHTMIRSHRPASFNQHK